MCRELKKSYRWVLEQYTWRENEPPWEGRCLGRLGGHCAQIPGRAQVAEFRQRP